MSAVRFSAACVLVLGMGLATGGSSEAATVSHRGSFIQDDDVKFFTVGIGSPSKLTARTFQYAGGTQADGTVIPAGGFDSIVTLFNGAGAFLSKNDDGDDDYPGLFPVDPVTGASYDSFLQAILTPGTYIVALTQYDNDHPGTTLLDAFDRQGLGNFTAAYGCSQARFCDDAHNRTGDWALDITTTPVPLPAALPLMLGALGALGAAVRRRA